MTRAIWTSSAPTRQAMTRPPGSGGGDGVEHPFAHQPASRLGGEGRGEGASGRDHRRIGLAESAEAPGGGVEITGLVGP